MALNVSWTPPPVSQLVVNNNDCTYASQFVAAELQTENESAPIDAIVNFLGSLVPDTWTDEPTDAGLVLWYYSWDESTAEDILEMAKESVLESCGTAICPFLQIEGDPDLAGLGMMATYYLVALLATIYPIAICLSSLKALRHHPHWRTIDSWFCETLHFLLDASLLFSISLLIAAIYRCASAREDPSDEDNTFFYSLLNAVTTSLMMVFPPLVLQLTATHMGLRRKGVRVVLWGVLIALLGTVSVLYYKWRGMDRMGEYLSQRVHEDKYAWLVACDVSNDLTVDVLDRAIITAQVLLGANLPFWVYFSYTHFLSTRRQQHSPSKLGIQEIRATEVEQQQHRSSGGVWRKLAAQQAAHFRALNIVLCIAIMWLLLGTFTAMASRVADEEGAWGKDRRWSIAQILALVTFVPLMIDIAMVAKDGPKQAMEGKLTQRFSIVDNGGPGAREYDDLNLAYVGGTGLLSSTATMMWTRPSTPTNG